MLSPMQLSLYTISPLHLRVLIFFLLTFFGAVTSETASPFIFYATNEFSGSDGSWSSLGITIGTPSKYVYLDPSTLSGEIWAIGPGGCIANQTSCELARGLLYNPNQSSTFKALTRSDLGNGAAPGIAIQGVGDFGLDTVRDLGNKTLVTNSLVGVYNQTYPLRGQLGLASSYTTFDNGDTIYPSLILNMWNNGRLIPSRSYGYTAGAYYRAKGTPASLIIGAVDQNRFIPNDFSFTLRPYSLTPVLAVNSITVSTSTGVLPSNWNQNPTPLLSADQAALFTIDTSTPFFWMPEAACDNFARILNLTYDSNLQLYLFPNNSSPGRLRELNLTFSFTLGDSTTAVRGPVITVPYAAFDLQLTYPYPAANLTSINSPAINYFPLRRATNRTDYRIGRAFLQEAYLTVDYGRQNFSVSQVTPTWTSQLQVAVITSPESTSGNTTAAVSSADGPLSSGAKAGIGVGIAVGVVAILAVVGFLLWRRRRRRISKSTGDSEVTDEKGELGQRSNSSSAEEAVLELSGDKRQPAEVPSGISNARFEMSANEPVEMAADSVSPTFFAARTAENTKDVLVRKNDARKPAELYPEGMTKEEMAHMDEDPETPVPAYTPADVGKRNQHNPRRMPEGLTTLVVVEDENGSHLSSEPTANNSGSEARTFPSSVSPLGSTTNSNPESGTAISGFGSSNGTGSVSAVSPRSTLPQDQAMANVETENNRPPTGRRRFSWEEESRPDTTL